jgi:hypothetical protein
VSDSDQEHLIAVTGPSAQSLDILARALHVKNAELQPTLEAIASTAVRMLSPALYAGLTVFSGGEFIPRASTGEPPLLLDRASSKNSGTVPASTPPGTSPSSGSRTPAGTSAGRSSARKQRD